MRTIGFCKLKNFTETLNVLNTTVKAVLSKDSDIGSSKG